MGFNFGAFAGGLAKSGMDTYQLMESIESQKKRDELVALQAQEMKAAGEERAALKAAATDTYSKVGTNDYTAEMERLAGRGIGAVNTGAGGDDFDRAVNQSAAAVALENKARVEGARAGIPTDDAATWQKAQADAAGMKPSAYTREQADTEYLAKVRGINPERALDVESKQMTVQAGRREQKFNEDFDTEKKKWNQEITDLKGNLERTLAEKGAAGVVSDYGSKLKELTGQDVKVVGGQVVLQQGGKTVDKFDVREMPAKIDAALAQHYTYGFADALVKKGMFKNASDVISFQQKRQEIDIAERGVKVKEAVAPSEIAKNYGAANMYSNRGAGGGGGAAGKAATAQQMVDDGLAPDLTAAYRIMASKDARSSVDQDWARTRLEIVKANPGATAAELSKAKETFYAENGVAPQALADAVTSGINPQTGKPFDPATADKLIADFNKKYPASKVDKADLSWVKSKDKTETAKPDSAIPAKGKGSSDFYSKDAAAARKAERAARDAAVAEEERKKREAADAESAKIRSAIATDFNSKYGR
jgi:hypothetical protein